MPSKSNARRRAARGIGHNGVPQIPSTAPGASQPTSEALNGLARSSEEAPTNEISDPTTDEHSTATAQDSTMRENLNAHPGSKVVILFQIGSSGPISEQYTYMGTIPTAKLLCASSRIAKDFQDVDRSVATEWQYAIQGDGFTQMTVKAFIEWLNTVKCPFPPTYYGTRQIAWSSAWTVAQIANLLVFVRWLDLKPPFVTSSLENRLWSFFKDHGKPFDTTALCALYSIASPTSQDKKLVDHAIWRAANMVQKAGNDAAQQAQDLAFSSAFASNQALLQAYQVKLQQGREMEEEKIRRNEAWLEAKANREWKEQESMKKSQEASGQRDLLDRRGVSTISWDEAQARRR